MNLFYLDSPFTLQRNQIRSSSSNVTEKNEDCYFSYEKSFSLLFFDISWKPNWCYLLLWSHFCPLWSVFISFSSNLYLYHLYLQAVFLYDYHHLQSGLGLVNFFYFCTIFLTFWPSLDKRFWTLISCFFSSFSFLVKQHRLIIHPFSCQFLSSYFWGKIWIRLIIITWWYHWHVLKLYKVWRMK